MRLTVPSTEFTDLAETKQTMRELDRKSQGVGSEVERLAGAVAGLDSRLGTVEGFGKHSWFGSVSVPAGSDVMVSAFTEDRSGGIATLGGSGLLLNRLGRWSLLWYSYNTSNTNGVSLLYWDWPGGAGPVSPLGDQRYRHTGVAGAGILRQPVLWTGWVTAAQAAIPIVPRIYWNGFTAVNADHDYNLAAEYLGGTETSGA